mmetsp:Transcript_37840/g.78573  ORF Transcript_37840/g.78573 Transcript_37840/m.78573 type:complete len:505 (-) Transcript_37840:1325-2839(-)
MMSPMSSSIMYRLVAFLYAVCRISSTVESFSPTTKRFKSALLRRCFHHGCQASDEDSHTHNHPGEEQGQTTATFQWTRRRLFSTSAAMVASVPLSSSAITPPKEQKDRYWPYWLALPVFPFSQRKTLRRQVAGGVWTFDQVIGIYYVHVPIRMTVVALTQTQGLLVYAPVAATAECLQLLQELIVEYGPVKYIILPSVAVEHKVLAGPFARQFPDAEFYVTDQQYSFPLNLPDRTLGLPPWTQILPTSSRTSHVPWQDEFDHEVLTVKPGIGSMYQDVALFHRPSQTLMVCDSLFATTDEPPAILQEPEYVSALLFHARDFPTEIVVDTPEARRKGWRRIVLLFNFFFPLHSANVDLGIQPLLHLNPSDPFGWAGWTPVAWKGSEQELQAFGAYAQNGTPTIYTIVQIILSRGDSGRATQEWVDQVSSWKFGRVIPQHLDAPLAIGPQEFAQTYSFIKNGQNIVRYCDDDVAFLRAAEEGPLNFSVYKSRLGTLRGISCGPNGP